MTIKKTFAVVSAASLPLALAACGSDNGSANGSGGNYITAWAANPRTR